jgi:hypothetical protein
MRGSQVAPAIIEARPVRGREIDALAHPHELALPCGAGEFRTCMCSRMIACEDEFQHPLSVLASGTAHSARGAARGRLPAERYWEERARPRARRPSLLSVALAEERGQPTMCMARAASVIAPESDG